MFPYRSIIICCKLIGNDGLGIRTRSIVFPKGKHKNEGKKKKKKVVEGDRSGCDNEDERARAA